MKKGNVKHIEKSEKQSPITNNQSLITKLSWFPKKTFELEFSMPWETVKKTYFEVLNKAGQQITIKGFRKGKAPIDLVEKSLDKTKLYEEVIKHLLPITYDQAVQKHHLRPIISPKIQVISIEENKDWQFKASSCERPEISLGDYEKLIKGELAKTKIWVPGKNQSNKNDKKEKSYDEKLKIVTQTLLETAKLEIADILIEDEVNRMLTRLLDQVNSLGMTIDQYLNSKGLSKEQLRENHTKQAEQTLKLEFILQTIVEDKKIKIEESEINKMVQATPDEKIKKQLDTPNQRAYLASIMAKRKVLDFLVNL